MTVGLEATGLRVTKESKSSDGKNSFLVSRVDAVKINIANVLSASASPPKSPQIIHLR